MRSIALALPVLPGKAEEYRQFAQEVLGPRRSAFDETQGRLGITKLNWYLQPSPQGDLLIVQFEADDIGRVFQEFGASAAPFDRWFRQRVKDLNGVDLSQQSGPPSETILEWQAR